ncbi:MAG: hypothetical protein ABI668_10785 [Sphingorhabdus sp.]
MTNADSPADCLERARMHDRLASATEDGPARTMHQAMAAEFRRRAAEQGASSIPPSADGPILEMVATIG